MISPSLSDVIPEGYAKAHIVLAPAPVTNPLKEDLDRYTENYGIRFLYDFFDEQGIYIEISSNYGEQFWFEIFNDQSLIGYNWDKKGDDIAYGNRTEAEEQAFMKAFEILEDRL